MPTWRLVADLASGRCVARTCLTAGGPAYVDSESPPTRVNVGATYPAPTRRVLPAYLLRPEPLGVHHTGPCGVAAALALP